MLERLLQASVLECTVGGMAQLDAAIKDEAATGDRRKPNLVIALTIAHPMAAGLNEQLLQLTAITATHWLAGYGKRRVKDGANKRTRTLSAVVHCTGLSC